MTKKEAIEYFVASHKIAAKTLARIERWDPKKNILENAFEVFDGNDANAKMFAWFYDLPYKKRKPTGRPRNHFAQC